MNKTSAFILLLIGILFSHCIGLIRPKKNFKFYVQTIAPDYKDQNCWAALPDKKDWADTVPLNSGMKNNQNNAYADVFFIHPTTYISNKSWNADIYDTTLNSKTDKTCIVYEATVFNESCRIYAPRYRQATLYSFIDTVNGQEAIDFAYLDVKTAFQYYLDHYNNGRPLIIASHSQGTYHAIRLIKDFFENDSVLRKKLIAAYLIGGDIKINEFKNIPLGDSANQTGCFIAWESVKWGYLNHKRDHPKCSCTNPLTWEKNSLYADKEKNYGSVPVSFDRVDTGFFDASCVNGKLWIHKVNLKGYPILFNTYHLVDYGLFYVNIRENVAL